MSFYSIFLCVLNSIYGFNHYDWLNSNTQCIFLVLTQVSSKVLSFHNEAHTSLSEKLGTNFLTLPIGICINQQSLIDAQTKFLFWFLFYLQLKDNHFVIHAIILENFENTLLWTIASIFIKVKLFRIYAFEYNCRKTFRHCITI